MLEAMCRGSDPGGIRSPFGRSGEWPPVPQAWKGETVSVIGGGQSAPEAQPKGKVIAVNNAYLLFDADLLYGCDYKWWNKYRPKFDGLKVTQDARAAKEFGLLRVPSENLPGLSLDPLRIHQGGNGGYQAINLAVLLGAAEVRLYGFEMHGGHWHGEHVGLNNPEQGNFDRWVDSFRTIQSPVPIINCTPGSALDCFPMDNK